MRAGARVTAGRGEENGAGAVLAAERDADVGGAFGERAGQRTGEDSSFGTGFKIYMWGLVSVYTGLCMVRSKRRKVKKSRRRCAKGQVERALVALLHREQVKACR